MAGMAVDGLVSGLDTTSLINKLVAAEGAGQRALQTRLRTTETAASAYRTVNTTFLAITTAAEGIIKPGAWTATKATSSSSSVAVTAAPGAPTGSLTFSVEQLATAHGTVNRAAPGAWTSATSVYGAAQLEIFDAAGTSKGIVSIGTSSTLADAANAINAHATLGLNASVVQIKGGTDPEYALQLNSKTTGAKSLFSVTGAGTFTTTATAKDAKLHIGDPGGGYDVWSETNTFAQVMPGATLTVSKAGPGVAVTASVTNDPDAVATRVQTLVDAVNSALKTVKDYTSNASGSTAALRGDFSVSQLASRLLGAVSDAVGTSGSPAQAGFSLTRSGTVTFDKDTFLAALKNKPDLAETLVLGTPGSTAADGTVIAAVPGVADRLQQVAAAASNSATGTLVSLATGQDSQARDLRARIDAWDLRLEKRRETLTRQFTAMETALSALKNQSTWLAGQLSALG